MTKHMNIYCTTLKHWCKSVSDAAFLGEVGEGWLLSRLHRCGKVVTKNGLEFIIKAPEQIEAPTAIDNKSKSWRRKPIPIKCEETAEYFRSITALEKKLKTLTGIIGYHLRKEGKYVHTDGKTYVYVDVQKSIKANPDKYLGVQGEAIVCRETCTRFNSVDIFSKFIHMSPKEVVLTLNKDGKILDNEGNVYVYERNPKSVNKIKNTDDNLICKQTGDRFTSVEELGRFLDHDPSYIMSELNKSGKYITKEGKVFMFEKDLNQEITQKEIVSDVSINKRKSLGRRTPIICEQTGERFKSGIALSKHLGQKGNWPSVMLHKTGKYIDSNGKTYVYEKDYKPVEKEIIPEVKEVIVPTQSESHIELCDEQITLQDTLISFVRKKMYNEAAILCESMQKIYLSK